MHAQTSQMINLCKVSVYLPLSSGWSRKKACNMRSSICCRCNIHLHFLNLMSEQKSLRRWKMTQLSLFQRARKKEREREKKVQKKWPTKFICIFIGIISMQIRHALSMQQRYPTSGLIKTINAIAWNIDVQQHYPFPSCEWCMLTSNLPVRVHSLGLFIKHIWKLCGQNDYSPWMKRAFVLECISGKPPFRLHALTLTLAFYC